MSLLIQEYEPNKFREIPRSNMTMTSLDEVVEDRIRMPLNALLSPNTTDEERARFGLYLIEPTPVPSGHVLTEQSFERIDGVVTHVAVTQPIPVTREDVNIERDRRIDGGFTFNGVRFQTRPQDRENLAGAYSMAQSAIILSGAQAGDLYWHGGTEPFGWIAEDNSVVPMDAFTILAFGNAMAAHKHAHIFAARAIKDMDPLPVDYTDDSYWA